MRVAADKLVTLQGGTRKCQTWTSDTRQPPASTFWEIITSEARGRTAASKCQRRRTQPERKVSSSRGWWALARLIASSLGCLAASETSRRFQPEVSSDVGALRENVFSQSQ